MTCNVSHIMQPDPTPLRDQVKQEMERRGMTQRQAAKEAGIPQTRFSLWLNERYDGNNEPIEAAIEKWLMHRASKDVAFSTLPEAPGWTLTPTAERVRNALAFAQLSGSISVVYGGAGLGKTLTCEEYERNNPNVWIMTATEASASVAGCLGRIALALGLHDFPRRSSRLELAIFDRLKGTHGLLIVDEAQRLTNGALETVRSLNDETGIGVALLGNLRVYDRVSGGGSSNFAQLFSRIAKRVKLNTPKKGDVDMLADAWGIVDTKIIKKLHEIAGKPGALRSMTKVLQLAGMIAGGGGEAVTYKHVMSAWRDLGMDGD